MEMITLALFEMGREKKKQARIMIMLYVCTNKIRPLPPRKDGTATGRAIPVFGSQCSLPVIRAEDGQQQQFGAGESHVLCSGPEDVAHIGPSSQGTAHIVESSASSPVPQTLLQDSIEILIPVSGPIQNDDQACCLRRVRMPSRRTSDGFNSEASQPTSTWPWAGRLSIAVEETAS